VHVNSIDGSRSKCWWLYIKGEENKSSFREGPKVERRVLIGGTTVLQANEKLADREKGVKNFPYQLAATTLSDLFYCAQPGWRVLPCVACHSVQDLTRWDTLACPSDIRVTQSPKCGILAIEILIRQILWVNNSQFVSHLKYNLQGEYTSKTCLWRIQSNRQCELSYYSEVLYHLVARKSHSNLTRIVIIHAKYHLDNIKKSPWRICTQAKMVVCWPALIS
jgi:hypothetical protein